MRLKLELPSIRSNSSN